MMYKLDIQFFGGRGAVSWDSKDVFGSVEKALKQLNKSVQKVEKILEEYQWLNSRKIDYAKEEVTFPNGEKMTLDEYDQRVKKSMKEYQAEADKQKKITKKLGIDMDKGTIKNALGKDVPFMFSVPTGWKEDTHATTAPIGFTWVNNGKSHFSKEFKSAIVPISALR